jgi:hypothetical protein
MLIGLVLDGELAEHVLEPSAGLVVDDLDALSWVLHHDHNTCSGDRPTGEIKRRMKGLRLKLRPQVCIFEEES